MIMPNEISASEKQSVSVLDLLLKTEAEAAALVNDAQLEADRRIHDNEEKNRLSFDEKIKNEIQKQELNLKVEKEKINSLYENALNDYRNEIKNITSDENRFFDLLNKYLNQKPGKENDAQ